VVIGDFRISLQVSARLEGVPYVSISNAYWSPFIQQEYVVPDLPFTRWLGPRLGQAVFSLARPLAFALHCRPMNAVRKRYGLPFAGSSLQRVYTDSDYTLYADAAALFDATPLPENHAFIGPIVWSPDAEEPAWWHSVPQDRPRVYVTLGSSGAASVLPDVIAALGELPVYALVSTAGANVALDTLPDNVFAAPYLHGEAAVAGAQLVVCNGGSPTTQQALVAGVPVIGLASNLDQHLNMSMVERSGAGRTLRATAVTPQRLRNAIEHILCDAQAARFAEQVGQILRRCDATAAFSTLLDEIVREKGQPETIGGSGEMK